jgi:hypothetical protein
MRVDAYTFTLIYETAISHMQLSMQCFYISEYRDNIRSVKS